MSYIAWRCVVVCDSVLQCVAACYSVLHCVAVCCCKSLEGQSDNTG